jgi:hypothetical protein
VIVLSVGWWYLVFSVGVNCLVLVLVLSIGIELLGI